jgi:LysR family transcriptional regulator of gallate degradation
MAPDDYADRVLFRHGRGGTLMPEHRGLETHLRCIRDFVAVAETGAIAKSSVAIFKAASAIARAIAELEGCLGVALFERKPRGMLLNAYGVAVRDRALRIAGEIAAAVDETSRARKRHRAAERNAVATLLFNGRGLLLLISLSEVRNLSAAASHIGLSQAGASMSLSRMEDALGEPLFHRMTQGMIATDAGARIVSRARRIFAELRHMRSDVAAIAGTTQGSIVIGALPLGRTDLLPTAIAASLNRHPKIRVTTVESPYEALVAGLRDGVVDFIVGALRPDEKNVGLLAERLFEDRLGIIVRAGHPLVGAKPTISRFSAACSSTATWSRPSRRTSCSTRLPQVNSSSCRSIWRTPFVRSGSPSGRAQSSPPRRKRFWARYERNHVPCRQAELGGGARANEKR